MRRISLLLALLLAASLSASAQRGRPKPPAPPKNPPCVSPINYKGLQLRMSRADVNRTTATMPITLYDSNGEYDYKRSPYDSTTDAVVFYRMFGYDPNAPQEVRLDSLRRGYWLRFACPEDTSVWCATAPRITLCYHHDSLCRIEVKPELRTALRSSLRADLPLIYLMLTSRFGEPYNTLTMDEVQRVSLSDDEVVSPGHGTLLAAWSLSAKECDFRRFGIGLYVWRDGTMEHKYYWGVRFEDLDALEEAQSEGQARSAPPPTNTGF